ncbi:MAG TPA: NAD(P)/FAD-dependent oxidoreductase [Chlamydiales bacterium]|nr:NAD(P)/FAD-dependent oxidoreductase [Chlamydiales bacterium]
MESIQSENNDSMIFKKISYLASMLLITTGGFADQKSPTVVVVGAGIAGLTTAYRLYQKGVEVQVYEARDRVGGRIFTAKVGGNIAELGGQNITDGGKAENLHRFIDEFCLELTENRVNLNHYYFDGETLTPGHLLNKKEFDHENLKSQLDDIAQKSNNMRDVLTELLDEQSPFYKTLSVRLAAYEGASVEKLSPLYVNTLYYMILGGLCSVHQGGDNEENYVDLVSIKGGNALLPEKLARSLGERVHLDMPLVAVSKSLDGSYDLSFQNGQKTKADILVLAIPCSVYSDIVFEEGLIPEEKLKSIKNVQYGTNAKLLVPFSKPPLKRKTFINDRIVSFFNADRKILILYYTGEAGKFSSDSILEAYQQNRPMLENGLGDVCPPLVVPMVARDESLVSYEGPVGYSWPNDPYVKGSYSYIAPGQEALLTAIQSEGEEIVKTLFTPIDQSLYFAGEHASILMDVPGTMEAACESGERVARMIEKSITT